MATQFNYTYWCHPKHCKEGWTQKGVAIGMQEYLNAVRTCENVILKSVREHSGLECKNCNDELHDSDKKFCSKECSREYYG